MTNVIRLLLVFPLFATVACGQGFKQAEVLPVETVEQGTPPDPETPGNPKEPELPNNSSPVANKDFAKLPDGRLLSSITVSGTKLSLTKGTGTSFPAQKLADYQALKKATQMDPEHKVQWVFMNLDTHQVLDKSLSSNRKLFGASSSKIYVGAALLDKQSGVLSDSQLQLMADMLVVSSNEAWTNLQSQIGGGNADKGREAIQKFTQRMGYLNTRGFQGYLGNVHGNELIPDEAVETLFDIYHNQFPGAEIEWKIMHTCRTGASRGLKYIPTSVYVGGKTGTYDGPTENPATGATYNVAIRNHLLVFNIDGHQFGLAILSNSGSDESAALIAGGLIREHTSVK